MALQKRISGLPDAQMLSGGELAEISQDDGNGALESRKLDLATLRDYLQGNVLLVVNGGFEDTPNLAGWTTTKGSPTAIESNNSGYPSLGAYAGVNFLRHDNSDAQDFEVEQDIALVTVTGGSLVVTWYGAQTSSLDDIPYIEVEPFDSDDNSLATAVRAARAGASTNEWYRYVDAFTIPAGTAYVKLRAGGEHNTGSITNAAVDEISAFFVPDHDNRNLTRAAKIDASGASDVALTDGVEVVLPFDTAVHALNGVSFDAPTNSIVLDDSPGVGGLYHVSCSALFEVNGVGTVSKARLSLQRDNGGGFAEIARKTVPDVVLGTDEIGSLECNADVILTPEDKIRAVVYYESSSGGVLSALFTADGQLSWLAVHKV